MQHNFSLFFSLSQHKALAALTRLNLHSHAQTYEIHSCRQFQLFVIATNQDLPCTRVASAGLTLNLFSKAAKTIKEVIAEASRKICMTMHAISANTSLNCAANAP